MEAPKRRADRDGAEKVREVVGHGSQREHAEIHFCQPNLEEHFELAERAAARRGSSRHEAVGFGRAAHGATNAAPIAPFETG